MTFGIILCDLGVPFGGEDELGNLMINSLKKSGHLGMLKGMFR